MRIILTSAGGKPVFSYNPNNNFPGLYLLQTTVSIFAVSTYHLCFPVSVSHFSHSVVSDSLRPYGLQHHRLPCPITNSRSLLQLMSIGSAMPSNHLILVVPFSSRLQSFLASGSFPMSQFFASGGRSVGASALVSVLPMNIQNLFPLELTGLISLQSEGLSRVFSHPQFKSINSLMLGFLYGPTLTSIHDFWKNHALTVWTFPI